MLGAGTFSPSRMCGDGRSTPKSRRRGNGEIDPDENIPRRKVCCSVAFRGDGASVVTLLTAEVRLTFCLQQGGTQWIDSNLIGMSAMTALGLALLPSGGVGQQKSMKEELLGAWSLVSFELVRPDGSKQSTVWCQSERASLF